MGEEFGASTPFLFFCDFGPELAAAVTRGRREEFARFERFRDPATLGRIPDPNAPATFERSKLAWDELEQPRHRERLERCRQLLALRRAHIAPRLAGLERSGRFEVRLPGLPRVEWALGGPARLHLLANLSDEPARDVAPPSGRPIYVHPPASGSPLAADVLGAWSVAWTLAE
jgi:1,4-alpha-glucan branching enzyme